MKYILLSLIAVYQIVISPFLLAITGGSSRCRYNPTCSEYAHEVIMKYGVKKGSWMTIKRILSCHPFAKTS